MGDNGGGTVSVVGRFKSGGVVEVVVGSVEDSETFFIHEHLLKEKSEYFRAALNGLWVEGQQSRVVLDHDNPNIFGIYYHWLYYRTFTIHSRTSAVFTTLAQAYILGGKLQDPDFQSTTMESFVKLFNDDREMLPDDDVIIDIYSNTTESDPFRALLVEMWALRYTPTDDPHYLPNYPVEFWASLTQHLLSSRPRQRKLRISAYTFQRKLYARDDLRMRYLEESE